MARERVRGVERGLLRRAGFDVRRGGGKQASVFRRFSIGDLALAFGWSRGSSAEPSTIMGYRSKVWMNNAYVVS